MRTSLFKGRHTERRHLAGKCSGGRDARGSQWPGQRGTKKKGGQSRPFLYRRVAAYCKVSLRMRGVTKISNSALVVLRLVSRNSAPIPGISPRPGTLDTVLFLFTS